MKNNLRTIFTIAAFCMVFACATTAFGQIKVGGFKSISVEDEGVLNAMNFALEQKSAEHGVELMLESLDKAEYQIVQGKNYRLCMQVYFPPKQDETEGVMMTIQTVIYQDLKGVYKLTSWKEAECAS